MHCLCCLSLLSLCCLSLFSLDLGLCHGFLLSRLPCVGLPSRLLCHGGLLLRSDGLLLRRGGLLVRSGGLLLYRGDLLLRPGGLRSRLLRPGGLQFSSAQPWWVPVPSTPPWWAPVLSSLPWLPALPWSPATPLPRGPGPPSLPLLRLRSTALLDCMEASGSRFLGGGGAMSRILAMNFCLLTTRGHSLTTWTLALH